MTMFSTLRLCAAAVLAGLALALSGCFMSPGKFTAELHMTGPDNFTFSYDGEIFFLGLSKLAQMDAMSSDSFTPSCFDNETFESRDCTPEEEAIQGAEWKASAKERAERQKQEAQQIAAIMGGIDPSDPKAADELVKLLLRQKGWNRVVPKAGGVFDVSYRVSSTLGHDFMFPMIEGFPVTNPFVQMIPRKGGQVRINAPGFAVQSGDTGSIGALMGMGSIARLATIEVAKDGAATDAEAEAISGIPMMEGSFTVRAAPGMRILANNTDDGPEMATDGGKVLVWQITARTAQAPTALIETAH